MSDNLQTPPATPPLAATPLATSVAAGPAASALPAAAAAPAPLPAPGAASAPQAATVGANPLALIALICSLLVPLAGIICGHIALAQIKRDGRPGRGLAIAALAIGYALTVLWLIIMSVSLVITFTAAGY